MFGALLVIAVVGELTGWVERVRWGRRAAWFAGALSGAFGGLVGNQGGIRSAAMLGFDAPKAPVYLATQWREIAAIWPLVAIAAAGVVAGTALGARVLGRIPQRVFRRVVAVLLLLLGVYMVLAGGR
ncbi:MAG TPA: hypothetical protein VNU64_18205 [Burkholderiales bacterium]|nr:hypothetical protein [Burkholderiales bacterium]